MDDDPFRVRCVLKGYEEEEEEEARCSGIWYAFLEEEEEERVEEDNSLFCGGQVADDGLDVIRRIVITSTSQPNQVRQLYPGLNFSPGVSLRASKNRKLLTSSQPSLAPVLAATSSSDGSRSFVAHPARLTLKRVIRACGRIFVSKSLATACGGYAGSVDLQLRFMCYQIFRACERAHSRKCFFARLTSDSIFVSDSLWLEILPIFSSLSSSRPNIPREPDSNVPYLVRWIEGRMSNFEYLVLLNSAAGRGPDVSSDHAVMPWVSDLTEQYGGWRDLTKTKFRLTKGDAMLDRSFATSRHHVAEPALSELALCIYFARRAPISTLRRVVRANFVAEQYPASVRRLFAWSPDECVPEFYCDPNIFRSLHKSRGLQDLAVPRWCDGDASKFVAYHRELLESEHVSDNLHHWIDLIFGHASKHSKAAQDHKNVPLEDNVPGIYDKLILGGGGGGKSSSPSAPAAASGKSGSSNSTISSGRPSVSSYSNTVAKLFDSPHPRRRRRKLVEKTTRLLDDEPSSTSSFAALPADDQKRRSLEAYLMLQPLSSRGVDPPLPPPDPERQRARRDFDGASDETATALNLQRLIKPNSTSSSDPKRRDARAVGIIVSEIYGGCSVGPVPPLVGRTVDALLKGDASILNVEKNAHKRRSRTSPRLSIESAAPPPPTDDSHPTATLGCWREEKQQRGQAVQLEDREENHQRSPRYRKTVTSSSSSSPRRNLLFPDYFEATYSAIGALRQAHTRRHRVQVLLHSLGAFNDLPFAGILLALPHILETLDNPMDWGSNRNDFDGILLKDDEDLQDEEEYDEEDEEIDVSAPRQTPSAAAELTLLVHTLGSKLGVDLSASALLPRVARVVEAFLVASRNTSAEDDDVQKRRALFFHGENKRLSATSKLSAGSSDGDELWRVAILRCGAAAFVRLLLPILVDVALVGTPEDSATTAVRLMRDDALGAALATRFLLPVATAGLGKIDSGGDGATEKQVVLSESLSLVAPSAKAAAVIAVCRVIGVEAIAPFVLPPVLASLAQLEGALSEPIPTKNARLALLELICVLRRLVGSLSTNTVVYYYVRLAAQNNNPLPQLLGALLPSTAALRDEDALADATLALNEVAALVSLVCMHVGEDVTVKHLLPDIDKFFAQLVHLYRSADEGTPTQGRDAARRLALDVARELYTPLAAMLSFDVMRRHAPSARFLVEFAGQQSNSDDLGGSSSSTVAADQLEEGKPQQRATDVLYHSSRRAIDWGHDAIDWFMRPSPAASNYATHRAGPHQSQQRIGARSNEDQQRGAIDRSSSVLSSRNEQQSPAHRIANTSNDVPPGSQRTFVRTHSADNDYSITARQISVRPLPPPANVRSSSARPASTTTAPAAKSTFHEGDGMELHQLRDARCDAVLPTRLKAARGRQRKASWRASRAQATVAGHDDSTAQRHDVELFGVGEDLVAEEADEAEDEFDITDDEDEEDEEIMPIHDEELVLEDEDDEDDARRRREALEEEEDEDDDAPTTMTPVAAGKTGSHTPARASSRRGGRSKTPPPPPSAHRLASTASPMGSRMKNDDTTAGVAAAASAASTSGKRYDEDEALFQDQDRLWLLGGFLSASGATTYHKSTNGVVDRPWEQIDAPWAPRLCVSSRLLQPNALPPHEMTTPALAQRRRRGASCVVAIDATESLALVGGRDGAVRIWSLRERPRPDARPWAAKADRHMRRVRSLFCLDGDGATSAISSDGARFDYWDVETGAAIRRWVWTTAAGVSSSASWRGSNIERLVDLAPLPVGYAAACALSSGHGIQSQQILALSERAVSLVDLRAPRSSGVTQFDISFKAGNFEQHSFFDEQGGSTVDSASSAIFGAPCGDSGQTQHPYGTTPPPPTDELTSGNSVVHTAGGATATTPATKGATSSQRDGIPTAGVKDDFESFSGARCVVSNPNGRWIAIGSDSGRISVLERHAGRVLSSWAAHGPGVSIVKLVAFHGDELLSVGADRIVTLWKVSSSVPHALAYARLDFRGPVQPHAVQATRFDDGTTLIIAASGHKVAVARLGRPSSPLTRQKLNQANLLFSQPTAQVAVRRASGPIQAHRQYFQDERSQRIHRHHFLIE